MWAAMEPGAAPVSPQRSPNAAPPQKLRISRAPSQEVGESQSLRPKKTRAGPSRAARPKLRPQDKRISEFQSQPPQGAKRRDRLSAPRTFQISKSSKDRNFQNPAPAKVRNFETPETQKLAKTSSPRTQGGSYV